MGYHFANINIYLSIFKKSVGSLTLTNTETKNCTEKNTNVQFPGGGVFTKVKNSLVTPYS